MGRNGGLPGELWELGEEDRSRRGFVTWRSVGLGGLLTVVVAGVTPYNDYVVYNTLTTGGYFLPAVALSLFVLVLGVNAPWRAMRPGGELSSRELSVVLAMLLVGAWASSSWPIAPIGYLVVTTWYPQLLWWSLFWGWLTKSLIVRFGGAPMYMAAKPFFVGLVFGECLAATFWLVVSFALAVLGMDYIEIRLLPT